LQTAREHIIAIVASFGQIGIKQTKRYASENV